MTPEEYAARIESGKEYIDVGVNILPPTKLQNSTPLLGHAFCHVV